MKVKDLKEKLNEFDEELEVMINDDEWGFYILNDIEILVGDMELVEFPPHYKNQLPSRSWQVVSPYNKNVVDKKKFLLLGY